MDEKKSGRSLLTLLGDGLLLLCAVVGFTVSFLSLYGDPAMGRYAYARATPLDQAAANGSDFVLMAVFFALLGLIVWSLPRYRRTAAGGLAALWAALVLLDWKNMVRGALLTVRTISRIFADRVAWGRPFLYEAQFTWAEQGAAIRLFLGLSLAGLAMALAWAVVRARRWWAAALLTLPPLLPGLLADLYPSWPAFLALCACWCTMLLTGLCRWAAPAGRGKLTLAALPGVVLVLGGILFLFPQEGYSRPAWALDLDARLDDPVGAITDFFSRWEGPFGSTVTYIGAAEEQDLSRAGPLRYTGRTVLRVTSDCWGRMYLRGSSLALYRDGRWTALPEGTYQAYLDSLEDPGRAVQPLTLPARRGNAGQEHTAVIDNVGQIGACVYAPYFLTSQDFQGAGMLPVEDVYLARLQGQWTHTVSFAGLEPGGAGDAFLEDSAYRDYVYANYLDVPEELLETFQAVYRQDPVDPADPVAAALHVAGLLDDRCEYDPEAPAAPAGADPVEYFLTESRRGYCMHYASAAALMLRSMGIPARYVSGYTLETVPGRAVRVPDRAAHAWVEVWLDGFGWYPVEVTPPAAFTWYESGPEPSFELPSGPPEESEELLPEPTPTPEPSRAPEPSAAPTRELPQEEGPDEPGDGFDPTALLPLARGLAAVLGAAALLWLGQWLPKRFRARRLSGPDRNRAALTAYGYLLRLERWDGRVDPRAVELARKARFSQHTLTEEELGELRALVDRERERLCIVLGPLERLAFRYLWGAPRRPRPPKEEKPAE